MVDKRAELGNELEYYALYFAHHYQCNPRQLVEVMAILLGRIIAMHRADDRNRGACGLVEAVHEDVITGLLSGIQSILDQEQGTSFEQI